MNRRDFLATVPLTLTAEVKAPDYDMNVRIGRGGEFDNFVDTRAGTADNYD